MDPFAQTPAPGGEDAPPTGDLPSIRDAATRILVVVDEDDVSRLVCEVLEGVGARVRAVSTAQQAWAILGEGEADMVVMDLVLPDTDGRKFLMRLRERSDTAHVPVVILSARDDSAIKSECFALGADGFFGKPLDPEALVSFVADLAQRVQATHSREGSEDPLTGHLSRAGFLDVLAELPEERPVAVVLLELDDFDELSHRIGWPGIEDVLVEAGQAISGAAPDGARVARWEGAEFILLLENAADSVAREAGEALLAAVQAHPFQEGRAGQPLTASVGVAFGTAGDLLQGVLETARYRLFRARAAGGNRLEWEKAGTASEAIRVIVAEDDPGMGLLLRARLEREGFRLSIFEDGTQAYQAILAQRPDLVLLDVRLPGMEGFDILQALRQDPGVQDVPVIMLTALGRESDLVRGFELGADDYMVKPFSPTELLARIHRLLGRKILRH